MKPEVDLAKFLSRVEIGNLTSFTQYLLQKSALIPTFIWTMNLSHIREVSTDPKAFEFLESNSLIIADGWPVKYLAKALESREVSRVPGVDLVNELLKSGIRFSVIGSEQGQVMKTMKILDNASSELTFIYDKYIDINSEIQINKIIELLLEFKPEYIFLALGFPKQEILFERIRSKSPLIPAYFLGIGGSFQLLSREKVRAPKMFQDLGLEWLWRLTQDPKRLFKRYYSDCKFLMLITIKRKVQSVRDIMKI
jgi:N-acetylglucosaminyldiphosphoundecaprenol N-acetyl-beta-D-mannosaminyltransferase